MGPVRPLPVRQVIVLRAGTGQPPRPAPDELAVEEPLEIRLDGHPVATTMRTPGDDVALAVGHCCTEGLLDGARVRTVRFCGSDVDADPGRWNVVDVDTGGAAPPPPARLGTVTPSCGWCGSRLTEDLIARLGRIRRPPGLPPALVSGRLTEPRLELFELTGAVHGAAAMDPDGTPRRVATDIGRHNAVDKLVGRMLLEGELPATGMLLWVSGRVSFEIVQKACAAGFAWVVAVGGATSLAVEAARRVDLGLAGFARRGAATVYHPVGEAGGGPPGHGHPPGGAEGPGPTAGPDGGAGPPRVGSTHGPAGPRAGGGRGDGAGRRGGSGGSGRAS